ncbi:chloramphenicol acetyltransferase [Pacificoceanicola onchidii]|uniref:chloramphenicol acetyltransferase n=1 Tax=Pacificoceanicola onchidii TaxID=2562685 RepID=UPI0010A33972|nr:chloramphenicol acetyltransferase [Pacificoceanicola onchidii]
MPRLSPTKAFIHPECEITASRFGAYVEIGKGSRLNNAHFGDYSYCDRYADIANARIGKFSNIAAFSRIGATDHPLDTAACHHFLYRSDDYWDDAVRDEAFFDRRASRTAYIGHDTWIGAGAMIKPEVTLGHGAVVASGAVVTRDVDPYTIVAGTPAKPLRLRQPRPIADRLMALAWWDWPHDALRQALEDFRALSAEAFLERYGG